MVEVRVLTLQIHPVHLDVAKSMKKADQLLDEVTLLS